MAGRPGRRMGVLLPVRMLPACQATTRTRSTAGWGMTSSMRWWAMMWLMAARVTTRSMAVRAAAQTSKRVVVGSGSPMSALQPTFRWPHRQLWVDLLRPAPERPVVRAALSPKTAVSEASEEAVSAITRHSPKSASEQFVQVCGRGEFALPRWTQSHLPVSQGPIVRLPSFGLAIGASGLPIARSMTEPIVPPINAKVSPMLKHCI